MLVVTTNDIPGWEIQRVCGEVFGLTVRSRNAFSQMGAGFKSMFGVELQGMTKNLAESRKYRNLRDNDQVAFVVDDLASVQPWRVRGVEVRGRAEPAVVEGPQGADDVIRIHPRVVFSWGIDPDAEGMTRRTIP